MGKCTTTYTKENGEVVTKDKKKFITLEGAIQHCKVKNALPDRMRKIVAYKCPVCHQYHVGRNGHKLTTNYKNKLVKESQIIYKISYPVNVKVLGKITL